MLVRRRLRSARECECAPATSDAEWRSGLQAALQPRRHTPTQSPAETPLSRAAASLFEHFLLLSRDNSYVSQFRCFALGWSTLCTIAQGLSPDPAQHAAQVVRRRPDGQADRQRRDTDAAEDGAESLPRDDRRLFAVMEMSSGPPQTTQGACAAAPPLVDLSRQAPSPP
eukprot:scaffold15022_cov117-Isochrysis_galbana.AAC.9